jgi:hypothetical protein
VQSLQQAHDLRLDSLHYSAFAKTSLLFTLRAKLITELYICGCFTNVSIYATAMDAARYGIQTTLVEDCLGYRHRDRHDLALQRLHDIMRARAVPASRVIEILRDPSAAESWSDQEGDGDVENEDGDDTDPDDESSCGEESSDDDNREPPTNTNVRSGLGPITAADIEADSEASDDEECMPTVSLSLFIQRQLARGVCLGRKNGGSCIADEHRHASEPKSPRTSNKPAQDLIPQASEATARGQRAGWERPQGTHEPQSAERSRFPTFQRILEISIPSLFHINVRSPEHWTKDIAGRTDRVARSILSELIFVSYEKVNDKKIRH